MESGMFIYTEVQNYIRKACWLRQTNLLMKAWEQNLTASTEVGLFHSLVFMIRSYEVCSHPLHPVLPTPEMLILWWLLRVVEVNPHQLAIQCNMAAQCCAALNQSSFYHWRATYQRFFDALFFSLVNFFCVMLDVVVCMGSGAKACFYGDVNIHVALGANVSSFGYQLTVSTDGYDEM